MERNSETQSDERQRVDISRHQTASADINLKAQRYDASGSRDMRPADSPARSRKDKGPAERSSGSFWSKFPKRSSLNRSADTPVSGGSETTLPQLPVKESKFLKKLLVAVIFAAAFFVPLALWPFLPSPLEMAKQSVLVFLSAVAFPVWAWIMIRERKVLIRKNFIILPILTLILIYIVTTLFSQVRYNSIWGSLGEEGSSVVTLLSLLVLFFVGSNVITTLGRLRHLLLTVLFSGTIVALHGMLQLYGVHVFGSLAIARNNFFNTVGSVYVWGAFLGTMLVLLAGIFLTKQKIIWRILSVVLSVILFFLLVIVNFKVIWVGLILAMILILALAFTRDVRDRGEVLVLPMTILTLSLLMLLINRPLIQKNLPVEVGLSSRASWNIAKDTLKENFLAGIGTDNFVLAYLKHKPAGINQTQLWNVRFGEARGLLPKWTAELGFLGAAAYLFFIAAALTFILKRTYQEIKSKGDKEFYLLAIGSAWIFVTFIHFFYLTTLTLSFLWWMLLAMFLGAATLSSEDRKALNRGLSNKTSLATSFLFVLTVVGVISVVYFQSQRLVAATHYQRALSETLQNGINERVLESVSRAVSFDPSYDLYHLNLSITASDLANKKSVEKERDEMTDEDFRVIQDLIRLSINEGQRTILINGNSPRNYYQLATVYQQLVGLVPDADTLALDEFKKAEELDPRNPIIPYQQGRLYLNLATVAQNKAGAATGKLAPEAEENLSKAMVAFEKAIEMKRDYAPAHFMIAVIHEQRGEIDKAIEKEKELLAMNPNDSGVLFQLGLLHYRKEELGDAQAYLEGAVKNNTNFSNARYFLGLIYDKKGERDKARAQFEKIAELNPDNEDVKQILNNLRGGRSALEGITPPETAPPIEQSEQVDQNERQVNISE